MLSEECVTYFLDLELGMMSCLLLLEKYVAARINYEIFMCLLVFCVLMCLC